MTEGKMARKRRTRLLATAPSLAFVLIFFLAPIIPVDVTYACHVGGPPYLHYTDWQSPSYHLFQIGYHYPTQGIYCQ
jgi:hypothetical protein